MISGTTPTILFKFTDINPAEITVAVLTIKQGESTVIQRNIDTATVSEESLAWTLSQEETLELRLVPVTICCDWKLNTGIRGRSEILREPVEAPGIAEVI